MTPPVRPDPATLSRAERAVGAVVPGAARVPGVRRGVRGRAVARPGLGLAAACAWLWGRLLGGRYRRAGGIRYFEGMPGWAFGRGGTTIGAIYLTSTNTGAAVLEHEAVHVAQWRRYGLAFIPLYVAAGSPALTNRFEVEAGLEKGGYVRTRRPAPRPGGFPGRTP